jgi:hypothetical protein
MHIQSVPGDDYALFRYLARGIGGSGRAQQSVQKGQLVQGLTLQVKKSDRIVSLAYRL